MFIALIIPYTLEFPPIKLFPFIPTPPDTIIEPVVVLVESVIFAAVTIPYIVVFPPI